MSALRLIICLFFLHVRDCSGLGFRINVGALCEILPPPTTIYASVITVRLDVL